MPEAPQSPDESDPRPEKPLPEALARLRGGESGKSLGAAGKYAGLGLQFVVSLLLFLYAGQWLDRRMGTAPLFLYVGVFTGAGAAFYSMYRMLMADQRREEAALAEERARQRDRAADRDRDSGKAP
ncbi:MAG: AtpZ/AtpI family protein [Gemmatimonadaceae bacterium]